MTSGATGNSQWYEGPIAQKPSNTARRNLKPDKHNVKSRDSLVEISEESIVNHEESEGPIHGRGDPAALIHELPEGGRRDRLGAVADGVFWIVVNLENQGVGAGGDGGPGHRDDQLRFAGAVRRIDDDRQVTLVVQIGHRGQWQGEPGVILVGADAPLAEHDVGIAPIEDVLGGKQELL